MEQLFLALPAGGSELTQVNLLIVRGVAEAMRVQTGGLGGAFVWPSLIRKLDRLDAGYRAAPINAARGGLISGTLRMKTSACRSPEQREPRAPAHQ